MIEVTNATVGLPMSLFGCPTIAGVYPMFLILQSLFYLITFSSFSFLQSPLLSLEFHLFLTKSLCSLLAASLCLCSFMCLMIESWTLNQGDRLVASERHRLYFGRRSVGLIFRCGSLQLHSSFGSVQMLIQLSMLSVILAQSVEWASFPILSCSEGENSCSNLRR